MAKAPAHIVDGLRKQSAETRMLYDKAKAALDDPARGRLKFTLAIFSRGQVAPGLEWLGMGNPGNNCDNYFLKVRNLVHGSLF
jgi:hypothetical protein